MVYKLIYNFIFDPSIKELIFQSFIFGIGFLIYRLKSISNNYQSLFQHSDFKPICIEFIVFQLFWYFCIGIRYYFENKTLSKPKRKRIPLDKM